MGMDNVLMQQIRFLVMKSDLIFIIIRQQRINEGRELKKKESLDQTHPQKKRTNALNEGRMQGSGLSENESNNFYFKVNGLAGQELRSLRLRRETGNSERMWMS